MASPAIMGQIFPLKDSRIYSSKYILTTNYGIESLRYLCPKIWEIVPEELKRIASLNTFKIKIKLWNPQHFPCKLCKLYIYMGLVTLIKQVIRLTWITSHTLSQMNCRYKHFNDFIYFLCYLFYIEDFYC